MIFGDTGSKLVRTKKERQELWKPYVDAMLAILSVGESAEYYMMNSEMFTNTNRKTSREMLSRYKVQDGDSLRKFTEWMLSIGMRQEYKEIHEELGLLPEAKRQKYVQAAGSPEELYKRNVVNYYLRRVPSGGIGAYDFTITLYNCFAGYNLRFITEEETWEYAERLVWRAKENYHNWYDYTLGFAIGLEYWSLPHTSNFVSNERNRLIRLLTLKQSPLQKTPLW